MASPSFTYILANSTTADASQVMQDFNDILNGVTDGTKDLSISALTCAGTATLNGHVNLGNSTSDTITTTGRAGSSYIPGTNATYDFGASSFGWASLYLGRNGQTVQLIPSASASATYAITLPSAAGTKGYVPYNSDGAATLTWVPLQSANLAHSGGNYTVLDDDGYATITVTTSTSDRTITLPTASANTGRTIKVVKGDSDSGRVLFAGEASELVGPTIYLVGQYESATLYCDGTNWRYLSTQFYQRFFRAYKSAGAGIKASDGVISLGIDTISFDALGWFTESGTTSASYFKPNAPGYYLITAVAGFSSQPDNVEWSIYIRHAPDGSTYATNAQITTSGNGDDEVTTLTALVYMDGSDDRVQLALSNVNGTDITTTATARYYIQGQWVGP